MKKDLKILLFSVAYACCLVAFSNYNHRLAFAPTFDDVCYFIDGYKRLNNFWENGLTSFFFALVEQPPHSPGATALALLSFALFGIADWAPYVLNFINIFLYLRLILKVLAETKNGWTKNCLFIIALSPAFCVNAILEFRPDFLSAILLCTGIFDLVDQTKITLKQAIKAGIWSGTAVLCKPTTFPFTILLIVFVAILAYLKSIIINKRQNSQKPFFKSHYFIYFCVSVFPFIIYFILNGGHYLNYIYSTFVEQKASWVRQGSLSSLLLYHLNGESGIFQFGTSKKIWAFLIGLLPALFILLRQHDLSKTLQYICHFLIICVGFFGAGLAKVANPFSGLTPQIYLVLFFLLGWVEILKKNKLFYKMGLLILVGYIVLNFRLPNSYAWLQTKSSLEGLGLNDLTINLVNSIKENQQKPEAKILFTFASYFQNAQTFSWISIKEKTSLKYDNLPYYCEKAPLVELENSKERYEFVITATENTFSMITPLSKHAEILYQNIKSDKMYKKVSEWKVANGGVITLFQKIGNRAETK